MGGEVHALEIVDGHDVINAADLQLSVLLGVGGHGGAAVHLQQPRLPVAVEDEVETVELEGVGGIGDELLDGKQRLGDTALDVIEGVVGHLDAQFAEHELLQFGEEPLAADPLDVVGGVDVDGHVGEVLICVGGGVQRLSVSVLS